MTTDISVGVRWDPIANHEVIEDYEFEYDGGNSSSRLFERSRIKALAGKTIIPIHILKNVIRFNAIFIHLFSLKSQFRYQYFLIWLP